MGSLQSIDNNISWPLLPTPDDKGFLHYPSLEESIRQSIQVILLTRRGERIMRPTFGGGLEDTLYEQNTLSTRREIRELIDEALQRWESRIILGSVEVGMVEDEPTIIRVDIAYRIRQTNQSKQLGFNVELEA